MPPANQQPAAPSRAEIIAKMEEYAEKYVYWREFFTWNLFSFLFIESYTLNDTAMTITSIVM